jgi:hypothetical protein
MVIVVDVGGVGLVMGIVVPIMMSWMSRVSWGRVSFDWRRLGGLVSIMRMSVLVCVGMSMAWMSWKRSVGGHVLALLSRLTHLSREVKLCRVEWVLGVVGWLCMISDGRSHATADLWKNSSFTGSCSSR